MFYTFWHGSPDEEALQEARASIEALRSDNWKDGPIYIDGLMLGTQHKALALELFDALRVNQTAASFILCNSVLDEEIEKAVSRCLEENRGLRSVTLRNIRGADGEAYALPIQAFAANPNLDRVSLHMCALSSVSAFALGKTLQSVRSVYLTKVQVNDDISFFAKALKTSRTLQTLVIQYTELSPDQFAVLMDAVAANTSIVSLNLDVMKLSLENVTSIASMLQQNSSMTELSLRRTLIDHKCVAELMQNGVSNNTTLRKLYLSDNELGDEAASAMFPVLQNNTSLHELCLFRTGMTRVGCAMVADGLSHATGLRKLTMDGNEYEGCSASFRRALDQNMVLTQVARRMQRLTISGPAEDVQRWKEVGLLLRANKAKRRILTEDNVPESVIPNALAAANADPEVMFYLLQSMPALPQPKEGGRTPTTSPPGTKSLATYAPSRRACQRTARNQLFAASA